MSVKSVCLGSLVVTLLGLGVVQAQGPQMPYGIPTPPSPAPTAGPGTTDVRPRDPAASSTTGLSSWIVYPRPPGCCSPCGAAGPIAYEVYLRSGMSFPIGSGVLGNSLHPGWAVGGGARVLFFNPEVDAAWTVDLGLSNIINYSDHKHTATLQNLSLPGPNNIPFTGVTLNVTPNSFNRTFASLAIGREWFLAGTADPRLNQSNWRAGFDVGGRWGTSKLELDEIQHRVDVVGGLFIALHSDVEIPCGNVIFHGGIRTEWAYTWSDVLQRQNDADISEINLLFTLGIRF
jgi:hypothetical protein